MLAASRHSLNLRSVYRTSPHGRSYHWVEAGHDHDETIVLVHGFMAHSMTYRRVAAELSQHYRLIIPDLPAHGRDETFRSEAVHPSVDDTRGWLRDLLQLASDEPVHLVGHSLGATLAYYLSSENYPLKSLTLVSPGFRVNSLRWSAGLLERFPARLATLGATRLGMLFYEPIQWQGQRMSRAEVQSYLSPLKDRDRMKFIMRLGSDFVKEPDKLPRETELTHPTLIVWGAHDHILPVEDAPIIHGRLPGSDLAIIDDAGHSPMEDRPAEFIDAYSSFLDEIREGRHLIA